MGETYKLLSPSDVSYAFLLKFVPVISGSAELGKKIVNNWR